MSAELNTTVVNPSILSSTYKGHKCSEVFLLNSNATLNEGVAVITLDSGDAEPAGQFHAVNSDGWSELQIWLVGTLADGQRSGTHTVIGKRHFVSASLPTGNISTNVYGGDAGEITALNAWFSCPVLSSTVVNPGTDADANSPFSPPMGCHQCGSMVTWDSHNGGVQDVSDTSALLNGTTRVFGGVTVDVRGTKEITVISGDPVLCGTADGGAGTDSGEAYILGQFVA